MERTGRLIMWYEKSFRRHLCDMHIADWNEEFLSKFSPEEYLENLKKAKVQNAMLYFQSHVGLCYYPTKSGKMHNAFRGREDSIKRLAKMCHENEISVTGYYSLIHNNWAYQTHPEWRIIPMKGQADFGENTEPVKERIFASNKLYRHGLCCPNNPEYRKFLSEQIKEMCEYFEFEGMFFDMTFWPKTCQCEYCRTRYKEETGLDLPTKENWSDPLWVSHIAKRREWMGEFAQLITDELKSYAPHASVEHNVADAVLSNGINAQGEEVLNACDYVGGDLYISLYHQSFTCKFYRNITKNQPFEYMLSRCDPNLTKHTITKSEDALLSSVFLTSAHHGATMIIDAIDPIGTMDSRVYTCLGKVFDRTMPYEKYFSGEMIEDIGIYFTLHSKFNVHGEPYHNQRGTVNTTELFIKNNICCGITGGYYELKKYPVLIASCLTEEDKYDYTRLTEYVREGGQLYFSGGDCTGLIKEFFGAEIVGRTQEETVYIAPKSNTDAAEAFGWFNEDYPLQIDGTAPIAEGIKEKCVLATLTLPYTSQDTVEFASMHSNPPGIKTKNPVIACADYGKGREGIIHKNVIEFLLEE